MTNFPIQFDRNAVQIRKENEIQFEKKDCAY